MYYVKYKNLHFAHLKSSYSLYSPLSYYFYISVIALTLIISVVSGLNDSKDLVISASEKKALEALKLEVIDSLPEEFMKSDFYLIRWLRVANLDISKARSLLLQTVEWRKKQNITNILKEDWSDLAMEYEFIFGGVDREGRPIVGINFGDWDLRAAALHGKTQRLQRYLNYANERGMQRILEEQGKGNHVTRSIVLVDADGMNLRQHICTSCLAVLIHWTTNGEAHYPLFSNEIIIVNAPSIVTFALSSLRPFMSASTRNQMKVFNTNKQEWMDYLDKKIDKSQRSPRYGGTML